MLKIAVIGGGWIAQKAHIPLLLDREDVDTVILYDEDVTKATEISTQLNIQTADCWQSLMEMQLDGAIVCTPNDTHAEICQKLLNQKIAVLCEKPLTTFIHEGRDLQRLVQQSQVSFLTGFVNRYREDIQQLRHSLEQIGEVQTIEVEWVRKQGIPRPGSWFTQRKFSGGGVLTDLGSHMIDMALYLLNARTSGLEVDQCMCSLYARKPEHSGLGNWYGNYESEAMDVEDTARGMIKFTNGTSCFYHVSWSEDVAGDWVRIKVRGKYGSVELKTIFGFSQQGIYQTPKLTLYITGASPQELSVPIREREELYEYRVQLEHFISCIKGIQSSLAPVEDGVYTVEMIQRLYESASSVGMMS